MAATKYTYSISGDFPYQKVSPGRLIQEIQDSTIVIVLDYISTNSDDCDIWFKDALSSPDQTTLSTIVANHSGEPLPLKALPVKLADVSKDADKRLLVSNYPREIGDSRIVFTYNWADKCTWYQDSTRVTGETLTTSDDLTFSSTHTFWIDVMHGRMSHEGETTTLPDPSVYTPIIYVDGVPATERPPFSGTGGDFVADYDAGTVTFSSSQAGKTITADYSYAGSSLFIFAPSANKTLQIEKSEIQYSSDIVMNGTFKYAPWVINPADPPNKIQAAPAHVYKTLKDFVTEANGVYPIHPACPAANGRGLNHDHINAPFDYGVVRSLDSSLGAEVRIWIDNDVPCDGEFGEMTFYCIEYDELNE